MLVVVNLVSSDLGIVLVSGKDLVSDLYKHYIKFNPVYSFDWTRTPIWANFVHLRAPIVSLHRFIHILFIKTQSDLSVHVACS